MIVLDYTLLYTAAKAGIITESDSDNTIRQLQRIYTAAPVCTSCIDNVVQFKKAA